MSEAENNDKAQVGIDRSSARLAAVQALYEMDMTDITADSVINEFLKQRWKPSPGMQNDEEEDLPDLADPDGALLAELIRGVSATTARAAE